MSIGCLSCAPNRGPGLQPRHVPWLGIEAATFRFAGQHPAEPHGSGLVLVFLINFPSLPLRRWVLQRLPPPDGVASYEGTESEYPQHPIKDCSSRIVRTIWKALTLHSTPSLLSLVTVKLSPSYLPQNGDSFPTHHLTVSSPNCRGVDRLGVVCHNPAALETWFEVTPGKQMMGVWLPYPDICKRKQECWLEVWKMTAPWCHLLSVHFLLLLNCYIWDQDRLTVETPRCSR